MSSSKGFVPGNAFSDQKGQAFAELILILAPLSAVVAFAVCMVVIASRS